MQAAYKAIHTGRLNLFFNCFTEEVFALLMFHCCVTAGKHPIVHSQGTILLSETCYSLFVPIPTKLIWRPMMLLLPQMFQATDEEMIDIGHCIVTCLRGAGMAVEWNGSPDATIVIKVIAHRCGHA